MPTALRAEKARLQVAALPLRFSDDGTAEVLLVTTRTTKRWTIPKGWPVKGLKAHEAAAREAEEEAGVRGKMRKKSIGKYLYWKRMADDAVLCRVKVFELIVEQRLEDWPERDERRQQWFRLSDAADLAGETGLGALLRSLKASSM
jgi:8-oxo-dGTP pyrophosphatase MutT (NUDIX family)